MRKYLPLLESVLGSKPENITYLSQEEIFKYLPNRPPSLLIEEALIFECKGGRWIAARYFVSEEKCKGHYPNMPIARFSDILEFGGQTGALLLKKMYFWDKEVQLFHNPLAVKTDEIRFKGKGPVYANQSLIALNQFGFIKKNVGCVKEISIIDEKGNIILNSDFVDYVFVDLPEKQMVKRDMRKTAVKH